MDTDLNFPVFDRPTIDPPPPMTYEETVKAFEEIIESCLLRENEVFVPERIEPFVL